MFIFANGRKLLGALSQILQSSQHARSSNKRYRNQIMNELADLKASVAALGPAVDAITTEVTALKGAIAAQAGDAADLIELKTKIDDALAKLAAAAAA